MPQNPDPLILQIRVDDRASAGVRRFDGAVADTGRRAAATARQVDGLGASFARSSAAAGGFAGNVALSNAALRALQIGSLAGAAALAVSVREAASFSRVMAEVSTLVNQTASEQAELTKQIKGFSVAFGQRPENEARALYNAISAGITDVAQATELLRVANVTAQAGVTDTANALNGLLSVIKPYSLAAADAERVSDKLFATVKLGILTLPSLTDSLSQVTPTAVAAGVSIDELLGSVAALTATTKVAAPVAATQLQSLFTSVIDSATGTREVLSKFGVEIQGFNVTTLRRLGLLGFLQNLDAQLQGLGTDDRSLGALRALLGRVEAVNAALVLLGPGAEGAARSIHTVAAASGDAAEAAAKVGASFAVQADRVNEAARRVRIEAGEIFAKLFVDSAPLLIAALEAVAVAVDAFGNVAVPVAKGTVLSLAAASGVAYAALGTLADGVIYADAASEAFIRTSSAGRAALRGFGTEAGGAGLRLIEFSGSQGTAREAVNATAEALGRQAARYAELSDAAAKAAAVARRGARAAAPPVATLDSLAARQAGTGVADLGDIAGRQTAARLTADAEAAERLSLRLAQASQEAAQGATRLQRLAAAAGGVGTAFQGAGIFLESYLTAQAIVNVKFQGFSQELERTTGEVTDLAVESANSRLQFALLAGDADDVAKAVRGVADTFELSRRSADEAALGGISSFLQVAANDAEQIEERAKKTLAAAREARSAQREFLDSAAKANDDYSKSFGRISAALGSLTGAQQEAFLGVRDALSDLAAAQGEVAEDAALQDLSRQLFNLRAAAETAGASANANERLVARSLTSFGKLAEAQVSSFDLVGAAIRNAARAAEAEAAVFESALNKARGLQRAEDASAQARLARARAGNEIALQLAKENERAELSARFAREELALTREALANDIQRALSKAKAAEKDTERADVLKTVARLESELQQFDVLRLDRERLITVELQRQAAERARGRASDDVRAEASRLAIQTRIADQIIRAREASGDVTETQAFAARQKLELDALVIKRQEAQRFADLQKSGTEAQADALRTVAQIEFEILGTKRLQAAQEVAFKAAREERRRGLELELRQSGIQLAFAQRIADAAGNEVLQTALAAEARRRSIDAQIESLQAGKQEEETQQRIALLLNERARLEIEIAETLRGQTRELLEQGRQQSLNQASAALSKGPFGATAGAAVNIGSQLEDEAQKQKKLLELQRQGAATQVEIDQNAARARLAIASSLFAGLSTALDDYVKAGGKRTKELAAVQKAIAIAEATVNTALAVTQVLASPLLDPFTKTALAAVIAAIGGAQIGIIAATPTYHDGGFVSGSGTGRGGLRSDEVQATLQTGEFVVSRRGVAALEALNRGDAGSAGVAHGATRQIVQVPILSSDDLAEKMVNSTRLRGAVVEIMNEERASRG